MPNWCTNKLTVTAKDNKSLKKFVNTVETEDNELDFRTTVPLPDGAEVDAQYRLWSTKWGASDTHREEGLTLSHTDKTIRRAVCYHYQTAWSPAEKWLVKTAKQFPNLRFTVEYHEPGMDYAGVMQVQGGILISFEEVKELNDFVKSNFSKSEQEEYDSINDEDDAFDFICETTDAVLEREFYCQVKQSEEWREIK